MKGFQKGFALAAVAAALYGIGLAVAQEAEPVAPPPATESLAEPNAPVLDATQAAQAQPAEPADAAPAERRDLTPPDLGPLQVTIYADGRALVQQRRDYQVSVGRNALALAPVAAGIDGSTARLRPVTPTPGFRVLEQTVSGRGTAEDLVRAAVGQRIKLRDGDYSLEGTLLAVDDQGVLIAGSDGLHVHPEGELILPRGAGDPRPEAGLQWLVEAAEAGLIETEVSYLTEGLTWSADYSLTVGDSDRSVAFEGWVSVANDSGMSYAAAGLLFTSAPGDGSGGKAPHPRYYLPRKVDLASGERKRLSLFALPAARSAVRYEARLNPTGVEALRLIAELTNDAAAGLGVPLPPGPVRLYAPDRVGRLALTGEQRTGAVSLDQKLRFDLGPADDLEVEAEATSGPDGVLRRVVRLRNLRTEDITVRVVERRPGEWRVTSSATAFTPPAEGAAATEVTVPANGTAKLVYELTAAAPTEGSAA